MIIHCARVVQRLSSTSSSVFIPFMRPFNSLSANICRSQQRVVGEVFNLPPDSPTPLLWIQCEAASVRVKALLISSSQTSATAALFGSDELFHLDLLAGQSPLRSMAQALCVCTAQWSTVKGFDASVGGPQWKKWCLTRALHWTENVVFLQRTPPYLGILFLLDGVHNVGQWNVEDNLWRFFSFRPCLCNHRFELNLCKLPYNAPFEPHEHARHPVDSLSTARRK